MGKYSKCSCQMWDSDSKLNKREWNKIEEKSGWILYLTNNSEGLGKLLSSVCLQQKEKEENSSIS